jgi:hypothetical protein
MSPTIFQWLCAAAFLLAIVHTFCTPYFERLAHRQPAHAGLWHWLGEVEVVFGVWALLMLLAMAALVGGEATVEYIDTRNYTEPLFVFAIMVMAATRAVLQAATRLVNGLTRALLVVLPLPGSHAHFFVLMSVVPLLGSLITEPAAMTLAALMLGQQYFSRGLSETCRYAILGTLLVNISIGGTLTHFAAPPVLMVAGTWGWDAAFMFNQFGWKAALAVLANTVLLALIFRRELAALPLQTNDERASAPPVPLFLITLHLLFLLGVVVFAHHPAIFLGLLLFFMGIAHAYEQHQDRLILKEALLVAFFLAGLVVLGGQQAWWLKPLLLAMDADAVFIGAIALTAFTDNAALTYLGSLVEGLSEGFKYALVAGAVTGGGLTIIANAPNPAGIALLRNHFSDSTVSPVGLLRAAVLPTLIAALAFRYL